MGPHSRQFHEFAEKLRTARKSRQNFARKQRSEQMLAEQQQLKDTSTPVCVSPQPESVPQEEPLTLEGLLELSCDSKPKNVLMRMWQRRGNLSKHGHEHEKSIRPDTDDVGGGSSDDEQREIQS